MTELETENQELQSTNALQASEKAALQQLLADTRERHEQRERENLETYEEKLKLESTLAAIKRGDPVQGYPIQSAAGDHHAHEFRSTEVFKKMQGQISTGQKRSAELEAEILKLREQLQKSEKERMSSESRYQKTIKLQSNTLSGLLDDRKKRQSRGDERAPGHDEKATQPRTENSDQELQKILHMLQNATAGRPNQASEESESKHSVDYPISALVDQVISSKERLAKRAAVQQDILSPPAESAIPRRPQSAFCPPAPRFSQAPTFPQSPGFPPSPGFPQPPPSCPQSPRCPQALRTRNESWQSLTQGA